MLIEILTLFPKMFEGVLSESMLKRAQAKGKLKIKIHDLRDWTTDSHKSADDKPFGGGPGMVMKVEPVYLALKEVLELKTQSSKLKSVKSKGKTKIILMTPQGKRLDQKLVKKLSEEKHLVLICGHYEGVDERIKNFVDEEISIGDYILTCGEIPAMVVIDAVTRLIPGVVGDKDSLKSESFENGLLEYPQYTRPADFIGMEVPAVLLSGDHKKIEAWRRRESLKKTKLQRPDLLIKRNMLA